MPSRIATSPAIALSDLRGCTDAAGICELLRKLRYSVQPAPISVTLDQDDLPGKLRDGVLDRYLLAQVRGTRVGEPWLEVTLFCAGARHTALQAGSGGLLAHLYTSWH